MLAIPFTKIQNIKGRRHVFFLFVCLCVCVCVCVCLTDKMKDGERTEIVRDRFNLRLDSSNAA